eukprot:12880125-Prorocentrum_lima.AAC.1
MLASSAYAAFHWQLHPSAVSGEIYLEHDRANPPQRQHQSSNLGVTPRVTNEATTLCPLA